MEGSIVLAATTDCAWTMPPAQGMAGLSSSVGNDRGGLVVGMPVGGREHNVAWVAAQGCKRPSRGRHQQVRRHASQAWAGGALVVGGWEGCDEGSERCMLGTHSAQAGTDQHALLVAAWDHTTLVPSDRR